ncbi:MAG: putative ABC transporter permease [Lachnospiraceae bacterium]
MIYKGYELIWLFFCYSFLGWLLETIAAAAKQKRFVNKGLINGPFCMIYGFTACLVTLFFGELSGIWLFAASMIVSTLIEFSAGHLIEKLYHEKWWDYSDMRWQLDGYISLTMSVIWGILCTIAVTWGNALLLFPYDLIPSAVSRILLLIITGILAADILATLIILSGRSKNLEKWKSIDAWLDGISSGISRKIYGSVNRRIQKAYPEAQRKTAEETKPDVFAYGCSFDKIIWLFMIGAFLGDVVETIFCRLTAGVWMSRSSVVWGPFSIVWGLAVAAATMLLYRYRNRSDRFIFLVGTFLGGAYEYICSVFTEIVFGKVFWDYSEIPFNLGGRINLLYCFFWGFAAVIWMKLLYPRFSDMIEKIPLKPGKILTWVMILFMCCNMIVSCMALIRAGERSSQTEPKYRWQEIMDERFDDERMKQIYPNAIEV